MVRDVLRDAGLALPDDAVRALAAGEPRSIVGRAGRAVIVKPLKWIFRKTFFVLSVKQGADVASDVFQHGYLIRHAAASGMLGRGVNPERVREAARRAHAEKDPGPILLVIRRALSGSWHLLRGAATALGDQLRRHRGASGEPDPAPSIEQEDGGFRDVVGTAVDALWYEEDYLRVLATRFDELVTSPPEPGPHHAPAVAPPTKPTA